jgi:hypothetical protein
MPPSLGGLLRSGKKMIANILTRLMTHWRKVAEQRCDQANFPLSPWLLRRQNRAFRGTAGVSANNRGQGFVPAYQDTATGAIAIARFADGRPAPVHVLDGLPEKWIAARDGQGRVTRTRPGIVAGFMREGRFFTREQAARASHQRQRAA